MNLWSAAWTVAVKDLRLEMRARALLSQIVPFGVLVIVLFAFALDPDRGVLKKAAPGLFWTAVLLAGLLAVGRSSATEADLAIRDGLRLSGLDPGAMYLGKAIALCIELLILEIVLGLGVIALYEVDIASLGILVAAAVLATVGIAGAGALYGGLASGLRSRETLLPMLVLPVTAPVVLGATQAFEVGLGSTSSNAGQWIVLLGIFAAVHISFGFAAAGALLEDA